MRTVIYEINNDGTVTTTTSYEAMLETRKAYPKVVIITKLVETPVADNRTDKLKAIDEKRLAKWLTNIQ